ncbi:MAG: hypothetical protein ACOC2J_00635 [bacterium]
MDLKKRYSLLIKICVLMNREDYKLSKISLQQLAYLFQELYSDELFFDFELYTYGPYSVELINDLDILCENNYITIDYCQGPECFGSLINPGSLSNILLDRYKDYWLKYEEKLGKVIKLFGHMDTRYVELCGTVIYLNKKMAYKKIDEIINQVCYIKPYFKEEEITEAIFGLKMILDLDK